MPKKIGADKGKVGGVRSTSGADAVEKASGVSEVGKVAKTGAVGQVRGAGAAGLNLHGRQITSADRDALHELINEEAEKLFQQSGLPPQQRKIVAEAVKLAVDAAAVDEDAEEPKK